MFPPEFEKYVNNELGSAEARALLAALDGEPVTSVRFNPFKLSAMPVGSRIFGDMNCRLDPVPWNRYGTYLDARPVFTLDPAMHAGAYYVQEASSQFTEHLCREAVSGYEDFGGGFSGRGVRLLDLCAAPGGKTTLYSTLVGPEGLVVANDPMRQRATVLADNVRRWGVGNVAVSCNEPAAFAAYKHWFDVLAVDAPCSGEGMFRRLHDSRSEWSPGAVEMCAARQRKILADAWDALRPGGVLIYSTCTFNRRENEDNVAWLAKNFAVEPVEVDVSDEWGVVRGEVAGIRTFRFWPHKARGEGFFAAVMRKADGRVKREIPKARREPLVGLSRAESRPLADWVAAPDVMRFARAGSSCYGFYQPVYQDVVALAGGLNIIYSGVCMGEVFGGKLRPDHALALFAGLGVSAGFASVAELSPDETLDYLRKREFGDVARLAEGLNLLTFEGLPVGWTKRIGHRTNTLLPNGFRIVNL